MDDNWLEQLKPGDLCAICSGFGYASYQLAKVDRLTNTQIIVNDSRYYKSNGRSVGQQGWQRNYLAQVTAEIREAVARQRLSDWMQRGQCKSLSIAQVRQILSIVDSPSTSNSKPPEDDA